MIQRAVLVLSLCFALGACAVKSPSTVDESASGSDTKAYRETPEAAVARPRSDTSDTVMALLAEASRAERAGDLQRTEVLLERSLRIEPNNAVLWHYLARMRLKQGRFEQASGLAFKSNSLAKDDNRLQAENWRVVAHARRALGDEQGARLAADKATTLTE